jgi:hypothetical protein
LAFIGLWDLRGGGVFVVFLDFSCGETKKNAIKNLGTRQKTQQKQVFILLNFLIKYFWYGVWTWALVSKIKKGQWGLTALPLPLLWAFGPRTSNLEAKWVLAPLGCGVLHMMAHGWWWC